MGVMKHFPWVQVNTSNVHYNVYCFPVFNFHMPSPGSNFVSIDNLVPLPNGIKPNLITVPHLHGSFFNIIKVRGDVYHLLQGLFFQTYPMIIQLY